MVDTERPGTGTGNRAGAWRETRTRTRSAARLCLLQLPSDLVRNVAGIEGDVWRGSDAGQVLAFPVRPAVFPNKVADGGKVPFGHGRSYVRLWLWLTLDGRG